MPGAGYSRRGAGAWLIARCHRTSSDDVASPRAIFCYRVVDVEASPLRFDAVDHIAGCRCVISRVARQFAVDRTSAHVPISRSRWPGRPVVRRHPAPATFVSKFGVSEVSRRHKWSLPSTSPITRRRCSLVGRDPRCHHRPGHRRHAPARVLGRAGRRICVAAQARHRSINMTLFASLCRKHDVEEIEESCSRRDAQLLAQRRRR